LEEAKAAGVIETVETSLAAIASHNYLRVTVNELRSASEQILRAIAHIMRQADVELPLCNLKNEFERFKRVQQWAQLANIVFSLIRFAGGSILCGIAGASSAFEGMQISNMAKALLGVITGSQAAATAPPFNRFLSCGNDLLSEDSLAAMPVDARALLEKVARELSVSMERLRQTLKETTQRMVKYGDSGGPPVTVGVLSECGDDDEDMEDAESSAGSVNGNDMDDLRDRFEGANMHERQ
jgi:hypothetical protein